jgi:hypothetical protein
MDKWRLDRSGIRPIPNAGVRKRSASGGLMAPAIPAQPRIHGEIHAGYGEGGARGAGAVRRRARRRQMVYDTGTWSSASVRPKSVEGGGVDLCCRSVSLCFIQDAPIFPTRSTCCRVAATLSAASVASARDLDKPAIGVVKEPWALRRPVRRKPAKLASI